ncbi:MAG: substrate-binding domain-containing protein [Oscillospiraceae bacterium]|nr:substrate-binding domain-containing protein [Oscillospiraceae bacterium]
MVAALAGCGGSGTETAANGSTDTAAASGSISVISREDGSGTRGAFVELFGVEEKDADGNKVDKTKPDASITNSTAVMMTSVANDPNAIGYLSLGSLDDSVKAVKIDGAEASAENIKNGSYTVSRPFNIVTGDKVSDVAKDFMNFILSQEGQKIVEDNKYIASVEQPKAYNGKKPSGKIVIAGSTSVTPVMEALKEAYLAINTNAEIEIQTSDSTTGITSVKDGICDIGMASRELKDDEKGAGLTPTVIAIDGVAVVVNNSNAIDNLTKDQVKSIYVGETTDWSQLN